MVLFPFLVPLLLSSFVLASSKWNGLSHGMHKVKVDSYEVQHKATGEPLPPLDTVYYFDQLIDHDDPSLGTFQQRYWVSWDYYQPGGPILLMNAGEEDASAYIGYLTVSTITGYLAEMLNGSVVLLEHRFFGQSNPYPDLTTESLRVLTLQQAIDDHEYFIENVQLPIPGGDQVGPDKAPWVLFGGSYPGALASYTLYNKPDLFAAGYASSAVVQAISDFWGYYEPTREYMPMNCSSDVEAVIAHVDEVLDSGNATAIQALKDNFGLGSVTANDDFAWALATVLQTWQDLLESGSGTIFYEFCDALEVKDGQSAGPGGWGLDHALAAWGDYYQNSDFLVDPGVSTRTTQTITPISGPTPITGTGRGIGFCVTSSGSGKTAPPQGTPTLVSRFAQPERWERQCTYFFPEVFSSPPDTSLAAARTNQQYGGWNVSTARLVFANGVRDPWREATVAANASPNAGSDLQPHLIGEGFHCSDMLTAEGNVNPSVKAVQQQALQYIAQWLEDWKPSA
ncbi:hypothetical protein ONZ51_g1545 [Trametes cubensis]|uniref:Peptidase S28 n=1 Tax=Trametes cubensis TaxID=1111947 RepID=A0AAD7U1Z3_9APHY|nr:hypothetical protein ONZ51_g1545 [Trametes cubensis]